VAGAFNLRNLRRTAKPDENEGPQHSPKKRSDSYIECRVETIDLEQLFGRIKKQIQAMDEVVKTDIAGSFNMNLTGAKINARGSKILLVNSKDINGRTPLHFAVIAGCIRSVRALISKKADIFSEDSNKNRPVDLSNDDKITRLLFRMMRKIDY
jgi:hypothetical protein